MALDGKTFCTRAQKINCNDVIWFHEACDKTIQCNSFTRVSSK